MSSRALILAAVLLVIGFVAADRAEAQENLDAGKTPSQIFAGTCNACHRSPRGLLKTVSPSSLPGFLRQHYTTSSNMAGVLASYLVSNGATDTRLGGEPKGAKGAKEGSNREIKQEPPRQDARPEQLDRWGRRQRPVTTEAPAAEGKPETEPAGQATSGPQGRKAKSRFTRRSKPGEEAPKENSKETPKGPKEEATAPGEGKGESAARDEGKPEAKPETASRPDTAKPAEEGGSRATKVVPPAETSAIRPDPVPPVTPAPATSSGSGAGPSGAPPSGAPSTATEMAVPLPPAPNAPPSAPATSASTAPPQPSVAPAGPPLPPTSQ